MRLLSLSPGQLIKYLVKVTPFLCVCMHACLSVSVHIYEPEDNLEYCSTGTVDIYLFLFITF